LTEARRLAVKSERERDYIAALAGFFDKWETTDYRPRALAFEKAMESVAAKYPDDIEAQILYALLLDVTALSTDKTFANQLKAAAILEPLFKKYPDHPGVAHYLIHTYDYADWPKKVPRPAPCQIAISAAWRTCHLYFRGSAFQDMIEAIAHPLAAKTELGKPLSASAPLMPCTLDIWYLPTSSRRRTRQQNNWWRKSERSHG
jgi:hypothetical protein